MWTHIPQTLDPAVCESPLDERGDVLSGLTLLSFTWFRFSQNIDAPPPPPRASSHSSLCCHPRCGPCHSCHLGGLLLPLSLPAALPSSPWVCDRRGEPLASECHFLSGALPPESCFGELFISYKDSKKDPISETLSVWAQMSASLAASSSPCCALCALGLPLPIPTPLLGILKPGKGNTEGRAYNCLWEPRNCQRG